MATKARKTTLSSSNPANAQLMQLLRPEQPKLFAALALAVAACLLFILQSYLLSVLFARWLTDSQLSAISTTDAVALLTTVLPWLALCLLGRPLLQYGREQLSLRASQQVRLNLRATLLDKLAQAGPGKSRYGSDGSLSSAVLEQVDALDGFISRYYVQRYLVLITPLLLVTATFFYSPLAAVILLITAPLVPVFMILLGNAAAAASQRQLQKLSRMSGRFLDLVRGMPTLQQLQATERASATVANAAGHYRDSSMQVLKLAFLSTAVLEFFSALAIALLALYLGLGLLGILPWAKGEIPVAYQGALFILLLAPEFYAPLRQLGTDYHAKAQAEAAISELTPVLHSQSWQHPGTQQLTLQSAPQLSVEQLQISGDDNRQRLAPLSFSVAAGSRVALQGPSGTGKSSLLHALLGFVPYQGSIMVNQHPLLQLERNHWQQQLGYMAQHSSIAAASIVDNLRLAAPTASDQQLIDILQQVELWPLVRQLPLGLETQLGERGLGLSGGQLQRLALAQLLLQDTKLWLLDEPTAHLDGATAYRLHQLIGKLSQGKSLIIVSHQLHGLDWLDQVVKLPAPSASLNESSQHVSA
ncbi:cysteine/glutathione ABC transporter permease/ATP-binding protein CydD [Rheinheimera aquimaris]|uniref:Cysteine/glutathione ABC transporter permease/ATP-binding protein CydD n=1 Tax=Rheinheimera aquimaris TaxID=412437 RepID=A0ABN1DTN8_9GAMM|nr:thiol reductant ABC exporter subunit CydD [Rheinheimera aquimaris]MCB5213621.1 thiol reductant ABC exporter subunit CydD [Rheinheimera aquimaris]